jgi:hypothetical protein
MDIDMLNQGKSKQLDQLLKARTTQTNLENIGIIANAIFSITIFIGFAVCLYLYTPIFK